MFKLSIVTPEKVLYDADVQSLVAPGSEGYLGVLSDHAPLMTALQPGKVEFRDADDRVQIVAVTNGFLEVSNNQATILADAAELAENIDFDRATAAYERHKELLTRAASGETGADIAQERAALARAANRLRIYNQTHSRS
jgi:F-type H+-transporting ATPase subunit epsilon